MVVCRFFMQGNCKYGNNCWNEHPSGGNQGFSMTAQRQLFGGNKQGTGRGQGQVTFGQNRFKWISPDVQQQPQNKGGNAANTQQLSTGDIVRALATEVQTMFDDGKMWPFTTIGFEKELPSLPGFNDISMEEMRLEAYEAQKSGGIQQFEQKFHTVVNEALNQRNELKNPSMTLKQKLIGFIDDAKKKKNTGSQSLFSGPSSTTAFGSSSTGGLFGSSQSSSQPSSGLFSTRETGSGFGQSGQQTLFGKPVGQTSTFGQPRAFGQSSGFGQSSQSQSGTIFGQTTSQTQSGTMFGQSTGQSQSGTIFGQSVSTSGQGQSGTLFGQATSGQTFANSTSIFGQQTTQSLPSFGQASAPKANLFGESGSPIKNSTFQTPTTGQTFFGSPTPTPTSAPAASGFGSAVVPSGFGFGSAGTTAVQAEPEDSAYTPADKLTAEELEQFKSQTFTLGKVPLKPPPRELCF